MLAGSLCTHVIRMSTIIVSSLSESWYLSLPGGGLFAGGFAVGFAPGKSTISGTAGRRVFEGMTSFRSML
jgi:hypothetical protein